MGVSTNLNKVYHLLGALRELQLLRHRIIRAAMPDLNRVQDYLTVLQKDADKLKQHFGKILQEHTVIESLNKTNKHLPHEFPLIDFQIYVQIKLAAITSIIESGNFQDDDIDMIRIYLNDVYYNRKIYGGNEHDILPSKILIGKDDHYYLKLLKDLGNYHNMCNVADLSKRYLIKNLCNDEKAAL